MHAQHLGWVNKWTYVWQTANPGGFHGLLWGKVKHRKFPLRNVGNDNTNKKLVNKGYARNYKELSVKKLETLKRNSQILL